MKQLKRLTQIVVVAAIVLAIWDQIVRDPVYRTWHGDVFGIPYDFRIPTASRIQAALWTPDDERLLSPHIFGVGWTPNIGRFVALARHRLQEH